MIHAARFHVLLSFLGVLVEDFDGDDDDAVSLAELELRSICRCISFFFDCSTHSEHGMGTNCPPKAAGTWIMPNSAKLEAITSGVPV